MFFFSFYLQSCTSLIILFVACFCFVFIEESDGRNGKRKKRMLGFVPQERRYDNDYPLEKFSYHENYKN
jgi:hypothetical protein